ncbi:MAG: DNA glycosylase AlkZ-like family protein [[Clostridium] scindens]
MLPFLPARKQDLWNQPSMYGDPNRQTVGGAVVSFLLRPCSFHGLVVFAKRQKTTPAFTSYKNWVGHPMQVRADAPQRLVRKFLHCYGPATLDMFIRWLGCSNSQGKRLWKAVEEEMEPVLALGKKAFILSSDRERLFSPSPLQKELLFLGGHDPYLDQRDRLILQPDKSLHRKIWQLVANPGAIIYRGEIVGIWNSRKKGKGMDIKAALWDTHIRRQDILVLAEEYAAFRQQAVAGIEFL